MFGAEHLTTVQDGEPFKSYAILVGFNRQQKEKKVLNKDCCHSGNYLSTTSNFKNSVTIYNIFLLARYAENITLIILEKNCLIHAPPTQVNLGRVNIKIKFNYFQQLHCVTLKWRRAYYFRIFLSEGRTVAKINRILFMSVSFLLLLRYRC